MAPASATSASAADDDGRSEQHGQARRTEHPGRSEHPQQAGQARRTEHPGRTERALRLIARLGGRYSSELGIDVDAGADDVDRWFLAATLFGTRIAATVAMRTFAVLDGAGIHRVADAGRRSWDELVALLDAGGYTRYDFRTATRLQQLAAVLEARFGGQAAAIGRCGLRPEELARTLDELPGWGPVTVGLFLRELRGTWPAANPPIDQRAEWAARHLDLVPAQTTDVLAAVTTLAVRIGVDPRDLESALVRASLAHHLASGRARAGRAQTGNGAAGRSSAGHDATSCAGGDQCWLVAAG